VNDLKFNLFTLMLYGFGFLVLFVAWMLMLYFPPKAGATEAITYIVGALGTLAGHIFTKAGSGSRSVTHQVDGVSVTERATGAAAAQGGFISWQLLALIAIAVLAGSLAGCASVSQAAAGYGAAVKKDVELVNDNTITTLSTLICATPLSAILRHPEIVPGLKALCLPGGAANPSDLLDGKTPITVNVTVPAPAPAASGAK
jgi:hypothetical protein